MVAKDWFATVDGGGKQHGSREEQDTGVRQTQVSLPGLG